MTKARIDQQRTLASHESEEELLELSKMESIYQIRQLRAMLHYGDTVLDFDQTNDYGQGYLYDFNIWIYITEEL